jgi:hypothetical protein
MFYYCFIIIISLANQLFLTDRKFFNFGEPGHAKLDWSTAKVTSNPTTSGNLS